MEMITMLPLKTHFLKTAQPAKRNQYIFSFACCLTAWICKQPFISVQRDIFCMNLILCLNCMDVVLMQVWEDFSLRCLWEYVVLQQADLLDLRPKQQHQWIRWQCFPSSADQGWTHLYLHPRPLQVQLSTMGTLCRLLLPWGITLRYVNLHYYPHSFYIISWVCENISISVTSWWY